MNSRGRKPLRSGAVLGVFLFLNDGFASLVNFLKYGVLWFVYGNFLEEVPSMKE